jgi:hypothetical protein
VSAPAQSSRLQEIVDRMTVYVERFVTDFCNVVAEEQYAQRTVAPRRHRTLTSDFLLVKPQGAGEWYQFRDVRLVDGKPVGEREARIEQLFLQPPRSAIALAAEITRAGTRYNLADVGSLNLPLTVMAFLQARYRERFRLSLGRQEKDLGPDVWLINFQERARPTLLRQAEGNADLFSNGHVWVEAATGIVRRTELVLPSRGRFPTRVQTDFGIDERLGLAVPVSLHDWHPFGTDELEGHATYGRFRRFQVQTDEEVTPAPR